MRAAGCILVLVWVTVMSACTAIGVVSSSDPLTKLNDAQVLYLRKNRPVPAERLIQEALAIYQREGDEHGLGIAYREYGDFLKSAAVEQWRPMYERGGGFLDRSITFDSRVSKAREFYSMALEHLQQAVSQSESAGRYDELTNVYYNMVWSHLALGEQAKACEDFNHVFAAYSENIRRHSDAKPVTSRGFDTLPEELAYRKRQVGCQ